MDTEIKALFEEQAKTFEEFKVSNDRMQAEINKLGEADALTKSTVEKLNKGLDDIGEKIKSATKHAEELEAKVNREGIGAGRDRDTVEAERKAAVEFSRVAGQDVSLEDMRDYKSGFDTYLRKGDKGREPELKAMSTGSSPDGGYFVTPDMSGRIVKKVYETTPMRQVCSVVTIGTDALKGPIDNGEVGYGWVGEQESRPATATPQVGEWEIPVNELYAFPMVTQRLLDDANIDVEAWLAGKIADKFSRVENAAFVSGSGIKQPKGLLSYPIVATADATRAWGSFQYIPSGGASGFASSNPADAILTLIYSLKNAYRQNARFLTSRATVGQIRLFKDGQGRYLWQPALTVGQPDSLLGYPIVDGEDMPAIGSNAFPIAFGDFAETYQIVDRIGIRTLRDPFTNKPFVGFYTTKRVGGGAVNFESTKFLKMATS